MLEIQRVAFRQPDHLALGFGCELSRRELGQEAFGFSIVQRAQGPPRPRGPDALVARALEILDLSHPSSRDW
jgi:hypothetical protein